MTYTKHPVSSSIGAVLRVLLAVWLLCATGPATAWIWDKYPVPIKDRPDWVLPKEAPTDFTVPDQITQGIYHLLVDTQVHVPESGEPEYFYHFARHLVNLTGVKQASQIQIDYNPEYQSPRLHEVAVWREGKRIDKLDTARITLVNSEKDLDQMLYSGEQTLHILLDDIRAGDTLEYSYTLKGYNPIYDGVFAFDHYTDWPVPVEELSISVYWQKSQPLYNRISDKAAKMRIVAEEKGIRYIVEKSGIDAVMKEEDTPGWFEPYGLVRFSESADWQDIADWARPLMEEGVASGPEIQKIANDIERKAVDRPHRIAQALQYVQGEIRYYGIEIGENSHRPLSAEQTLARRYGDCKDKAVLLLSILRALGIEAYAALVNSQLRRGVGDALPAINLFNHVIVSVIYDGKVYWLDPSREYQYGNLSLIHQPDYGYALVLKPGANALTDARPQYQAYSGNELHESFDLTAGPQAPALYTAHTVVMGLNAEKLRRTLAGSNQNNAQKDYLNFYKRFYPSIQPLQPAAFKDRPELNEMEVDEKYSIQNIWEQNPRDKKHFAWFHAHAIMPYLKTVDPEQRQQPLALEHPVNIHQLIEVNLQDYRWDFENEDFSEGNPFFSFSKSVRFIPASRKLLIEYNYTSKMDFVAPVNLKYYLEAIDAVREQSRYGILIRPAALAGGTDTESRAERDYVLYALLGYLGAFVLLFAVWRLQRRRHLLKGDALYYPVALPKFAVMWLCSFGLYGFYWFYRNWKHVQRRDRANMMPAMRGILHWIWYYPLYDELRRDNAARYPLRRHLPPQPAGVALAVAFLGTAVVAGLGYPGFAMCACMLLTLPLANYVNYINSDDDQRRKAFKHHSRWRPRHAMLVLLGAPLLVSLLGAETGLIPGEKVVEGKALLGYNLKFLQRRGVIQPTDEIRYFYSNTLISIHGDGNGFSDRHVFTYWKDDGEFYFEGATFDEIRDINVIWGRWNSDTVIEIIRNNGSRFTLYASAAGHKDRAFVNALLERWKKRRQPGAVAAGL
ncbi:MAG TPA: DUF3857 and transglutaminase domain-containing protein [Gammaproteobacteria bacterium]|nr:DUF3857 and transglutaminase domain-containing protein [Gammaproteobacteria bacterium]